MKVHEVIPEPSNQEIIQKLKTAIKAQSTNSDKKEYKTQKIRAHASKRKRKHNNVGETDPHFSNIDNDYGMSGSGGDAVINT